MHSSLGWLLMDLQQIHLQIQQWRKHRSASASSTCLLDQIIKNQDQMIQSLFKRIDDEKQTIKNMRVENNELIRENAELRKSLERKEISQSIEFKQFYAPNQSNCKFQPIFERKDERPSHSKQFIELDSPENHVTQLDLIDYITGEKEKSNQDSNRVVRTPILHQPIFRDKCFTVKHTIKGLIRSFYIKLLQNPMSIIKLIELIQTEYKQNQVLQLFLLKKYPDNKFIGDMTIAFLNEVSQLQNYSEIVQHLNKYQLYDDILTQIFINSLINFTEIPTILDKDSTKKCFLGLANSFELALQIHQNQYRFYQSCVGKRLYSQQSEYQHPVCEQISLNPRNVKQSISLIHKEKREPRFIIKFNQQAYCFQFSIRQQKLVEEVQGELIFSKSQNRPRHCKKISEQPREFKSNTDDIVIMSKSDQEFRDFNNSGQRVFMNKSEEEESELKEFDSNYDFKPNIIRSNQHFIEISSILSESLQKQKDDNLQDSPEYLKKFQKCYIENKLGSCESMLLSSYNRKSLYTSKERLQNEFRLQDKQNRFEDNRFETQKGRSSKKSVNLSANRHIYYKVYENDLKQEMYE